MSEVVVITGPTVVCGRKFCSACGRWRLICDFGTRRYLGKRYLNPKCRACRARLGRRRYRLFTPEQRARHVESSRLSHAMKRREDGCRRINTRTVLDGTQLRVPCEPFERWLRKKVALIGGVNATAKAAHVDQRLVRRVLNREYENVSLDLVDRVVIALDGSPLAVNDLYPLDHA